MRPAAAALVLALAGPAAADDPAVCARYAAKARAVGTVPAALHELSGLAGSWRHPGIYWAHNDSGNALVLFAIRASGEIVARFPLTGGPAADPEDIAVGPCGPRDPRSCVYLADTGDNRNRRRWVQILRTPEPDRLVGRPLAADALAFRYPDGPRNAEAVLVDPHSARIYVLTKTLESLGELYRLDGVTAPGGGTATRVRALPAEGGLGVFATAAAAHRGGGRVLVRTYGGVWEFRRAGARSLEEVMATRPLRVTAAIQPQAEAISYTPDGLGYVLGSEGSGSTLYQVDCAERARP